MGSLVGIERLETEEAFHRIPDDEADFQLELPTTLKSPETLHHEGYSFTEYTKITRSVLSWKSEHQSQLKKIDLADTIRSSRAGWMTFQSHASAFEARL